MNKIILAISIVVNLLLIALVVGLLPFLLALSSVIIGLLLWYIKKLTNQLNEITTHFDDFYLKIENYEKHVENIHSLEMFYGDQTLQGLITHSRSLLNDIYDFQEKFIITEEEEFEPETEAPPQAQEKEPVLYRNTPEGDS
tara:strand:+ start:74 stop:496 length:423 start_codon:yes stop_codon:yes gene_type:complete